MPPKKAKKEGDSKVTIVELTPLQKLVTSSEFDGFIIAVILVSCIFMAADNPRPDIPQAKYLTFGNYAFTVIFLFELVANVAAFGILPYLMDPWHWLDTVVVASSCFELLLVILALLAGSLGFTLQVNVKVLRILRVFRFFRVLRPLKALRHFKAILVFIESLTASIDILAITTCIFLIVMVGVAFLCNNQIGSLLQSRCVPPLYYDQFGLPYVLNTSSAQHNNNFKAYGYKFFFSRYNFNYCKSFLDCPGDMLCSKLAGYDFDGVPGDYTNPWNSIKTNMAFVTLRGWPTVFMAIKEGYSLMFAFLILSVCILVLSLFVINMFPGINTINTPSCCFCISIHSLIPSF